MENTSMREALEAARDLLLPQCNGGTEFAKACGETVNKIMEALKEERTSEGNAAAMREALLIVKRMFDGRIMFQPSIRKAHEAVNAALAAPPRNCDLFNGDHKMLHTAWFDWTDSPQGHDADGTVRLTFDRWLLEIAGVRHA
jgi:hypothetical protein